jgi:hypothetical protein
LFSLFAILGIFILSRIDCLTGKSLKFVHTADTQVLEHPLKPGKKFVYPVSTQRISFAEMDEDRGFAKAEVLNNRIETRFRPLPVYDGAD